MVGILAAVSLLGAAVMAHDGRSLELAVETGWIENFFWFVIAFLAIIRMLPILALERLGPGGILLAEPID